jgi:hypothetical protein
MLGRSPGLILEQVDGVARVVPQQDGRQARLFGGIHIGATEEASGRHLAGW